MATYFDDGGQVSIGVRIGYAKAPNCKMVVCSLDGDDVTVTCPGASNSPVTVTMTAIGTDRGSGPAQAGYVGSLTLEGLAEFTPYSYTLSQPGKDDVTGSFRTLPGATDDFCFYAMSCEASAHLASLYSTPRDNGKGFYRVIAEQQQAGETLPCVGLLHVDDLGYCASREVDDSAGTGLVSTGVPATTLKEFDYALAWLSNFGLLADGTTGDENLFGNQKYREVLMGRDRDKVWTFRNLPLWPQWGDWEFQNDIGTDIPTNNSPTANGYHKTYSGGVGQKDGPGYKAWDWFMRPIQPPAVVGATDTNANHWAFDCGPVRIVAGDYITNSNPNWGGAANWTTATPHVFTSIFGTAQCDDLLSALKTDAPFKLLGLGLSHQYMYDTTVSTSEYNHGVQHPWKNHQPTEWAKMFTDAGSLGADSRTNGVDGTLMCFHGDNHTLHVFRHYITDGTNPAWFYEICGGTGAGSLEHLVINAGAQAALVDGYTYAGSTIECHRYSGSVADFKQSGGVRFDVYGSRNEVIVTVYETSYFFTNAEYGPITVVWQKKFTRQTYNDAVDPDWCVRSIGGLGGTGVSL